MSIDATIAVNHIFQGTIVPSGSSTDSTVLDFRELSIQGNMSLHIVITGTGTVDISPLQSNIGVNNSDASSFVVPTGFVTTGDLSGLIAGTYIIQLDTIISRFIKFSATETASTGSPVINMYWAGQ